MTFILRPAALLAPLLLLAFLAPAAGAMPLPSGRCVQPTSGEQVCYDAFEGGACVWSAQLGDATDVGSGQSVCASLVQEHWGAVACTQLVAGVGTYGGFVGPYGDACVTHWSGRDGSFCAYAWGRQNGVEWHFSEPACVPLAQRLPPTEPIGPWAVQG